MTPLYRILESKEFFKSDFTQFQFNRFHLWRWLFMNPVKFEAGRISGSREQSTEMWTTGLLTDGSLHAHTQLVTDCLKSHKTTQGW
jgi:hypothetical protein